jgi:hypothetical protein
MRDYLSRLVIKTLNQEEVIQPRLVSLYEPPTFNQPAFQKQFDVEKKDLFSPEGEFDHKTLSSSRQTSHQSTDSVRKTSIFRIFQLFRQTE